MIKVLVVTYYWPPSGGSGVQRWMFFCKYLKEYGIEPIVLTVDENSASYRIFDSSLNEVVKEIETHKTKTFELIKFYSFLTTGDKKKGIPQGTLEGSRNSLLRNISAFVRGNFFIPDARVGWNRFAIKKAIKIIEDQDIKYVVTTGPPHSTHLIGLKLKDEFSHLKWIADFRDPWTEVYYNRQFFRTKQNQQKDQSLELQVLENADLVLTIGTRLKEMLQRKLPHFENKFQFVYSGYDAYSMDKTPKEVHDHFEITFIGLLTESQPYESFIEILKGFYEKNPKSNFKLCLAGQIQPYVLEQFSKHLPPDSIIHLGYVNHQEALKLMKRSQLLINLLANMEESQILISGKQMEYIATGNPILCLGNKDGESAIVLQGVNNARVFEKEEIKASIEFIQDVYAKWSVGSQLDSNFDNESILKFSRYQLAGQLSELIKRL